MKAYAKRFTVFSLLFTVAVMTSLVDLYGYLFLRWIMNFSFIIQLFILLLATVLFLYKPVFTEEGLKYLFGMTIVPWEDVRACEILPMNRVVLSTPSKLLTINLSRKQMQHMLSIIRAVGMTNSTKLPHYYTFSNSLDNV